MDKSKNLQLKDLVSIGIFSAIYLAAIMIVGIPLGMMVITYLFFPAVLGIVTGIVSLFFMAKVQKTWAVFIYALLPQLVLTLMGHTYIVAIHSLIIALIAEFTHRSFGLKSIKGNIVTHGLISLMTVGPFWQIFLVVETYSKMTEGFYSAEYTRQLLSLPYWIIPVLYITAFLGGIIGGKIGAKVLQKHFKKAGLV